MAATTIQNEWVMRVLAVTFSQATPPLVDEAGAEDGVDAPEDPYYLAERLQDARQQTQGLKRAGDPAAEELGSLLDVLAKAVGTGDKSAPDLMNGFEEKLASALSAARARSVRQETRVPLEFRKLLIEWHAAQDAVQQNIRALGDAYLDNEEVRDDPRFEDVFEAMVDLPDLIPSFGDQLDTDINALLNDGAHTKDLAKAGLKTIADYRKTLSGATMLAELEKLAASDLGAKFGLYGALDDAIGKIESQMKSLAAA